ncbi:hypothetical protein LRU_01248 [Ligilactobacillus ruminis SPM0211]|uniref:Uncharacterized protein n=1 Tax=Ligilactobacillus ruminis SPM0211 TaxID=1040964 RepID=F7R0B9_9LACO|nr:hypothetical protein LRU_01248 [Ligilactobacillus ruminis SPM0211]
MHINYAFPFSTIFRQKLLKIIENLIDNSFFYDYYC